MSKDSWKFWVVPLGLTSLYTCWYMGFQGGYDDGYRDGFAGAWTRPALPQVQQIADTNKVANAEEPDLTAVR